MPAGMANPRAGVTERCLNKRPDQDMMSTPAPTLDVPMTGSMPPRRINDPTPAQQRQAMRQARSAARRGGGGRKAGGKIYKAGGKVRGSTKGRATKVALPMRCYYKKGTRAAKMVTMKGS
jgi:hypothetical protein